MSQTNPTQNRLFFLDHIRVFLCVMVIMLHTAITYGAIGGWYCTDVDQDQVSPLLKIIYTLFNTVTQSYSMGFFFLIAGYFTAISFNKKGVSHFLKDRFIRLGIPLFIFVTLLSPITIGLARFLVEGGTFFDGFYWIFVQHYYECGPMWFVQTLLIFSILYVIGKSFIPQTQPDSSKGLPSHLILLLAAILVGVCAFAARLWIPVGTDVYGMQLGYFASYIVLFYLGCYASKFHWLERIELTYALPWFIVSLISIFTLPLLASSSNDTSEFTGGWNIFALTYAMWEPFTAWGIILGFLYVSRRFLSGTNNFLKHLGRCSYPVYFIHPPILVGLTLLSHNWHVAPSLKWITISFATCVCCWLIATVLIKLPGARKVF